MKKFIYILILFFISFNSFSQRIVQRSTQSSTVADSRVMAQLNQFIPRYLDTSSANIPGAYGLDTSAQIIYTYNDEAFWIRAHNPKRWVSWSTQSILPNGVYDGGEVYYTGNGLQFGVTAATYVLNNTIYRTQDTILTLDPADPSNDRFDLIVLTSAGAGFITGTPSATPQEPSINPSTTIARALVSVPAGSLVPGGVTQDIIYDENLGEPSEWTVSGTGTIDFNDTDFPFHLTKDAEATGLSTSQYISFVNDDTVHTASYGALVFFVRLSAAIPLNSLAVGLYYQGVSVGQVPGLSLYGLKNASINGYQNLVVPTIGFGQRDIIFDEIRIVTFANVSATFRVDYMQLQKGYTLFYQQPNGFGSVVTNSGTALATQPADILNLVGSNGITTSSTGKTVTIDASGLIRNDILFGSAQPTSGVFVDRYLKVTRPTTVTNNILDVRGYRGTTSLAQFIDSNSNGNGPNGGYLIHPMIRLLAPNMVDAHANSIYLGKGYTTYGTMILQYMQKNISLGAKGVGAGFSFFGTPDVPFFFWADSTFVIGNHDNKNERYKLDVPFGKARFNGAEIREYASQGGAVTDSSYIWKAYLDSVLAGGGLGSVTSISFNTPTGIRGSSEPITTSGTLRIDTTIIATRAWVGSGGGSGTVSSVGVTDGNGFDFTVTNPTTTPVISATTNVADTRLMYSSSGAIAGSSSLTWTNATSRLGIGAGTAAYLSLAASSTSQASLNIGDGGTAPTSPQNGDVWVAGNHILARLGGVTYQIDQQSAAGVTSAIGTANQVNVSGATGAVTFSLPQDIATTSAVTFGRLTVGGTAATSPLTFTSNTDATGSAGRWYYNGTRLGFSPSTTIKRVALTNDAAPANGQIPIGNGTDFTVAAISASNNTLVVTNGSGTITLGLNIAPQTLTSGASITWNATNGFNAILTLSNTGATLNLTNAVAGATYVIRITQGTGGSRTITTWPTGTKWPSGTAPVLSTAVGAIDVISFFYDGTSFYGAYDKNYL